MRYDGIEKEWIHMNRSVIFVLIAILLIFASAAILGAQGRGHFRGGVGAGFNIPPVVRPGPVVVARPPFAVATAANPAFGFRPVQPFRPFRPVQRVVVPPVFGFYSPYIWPTTFYNEPAYSVYSAPPVYSEPAPVVSQNEVELAYQVGQLSAQIDQLRQQQQQQQQQQGINSYTQPVPQPQDSVQRITTPTVLVFRDGRRMEIQNYAIVGETLWVLDERVATKIALADLDLDATQKENRGRGMRFLLPQK